MTKSSYFWGIIIIFLIAISASILFLFAKVNNISNVIENQTTADINTAAAPNTATQSGLITLDDVKRTVSSAIATISANLNSNKTSTQTVYVKSSPQPKSLQTVYIPLGGSSNTQSQNWVSLNNNQVYIDFYSDYGASAYATWDVFMKVDQGNGAAYARIFDLTNGVAVDGSELTTTSADTTQVSSGQIKLRSGRNLYAVQIKSLNGYTAFIDSARIKITY
ncbi:MAG: hypothetical protein HY044_04620 [Candidatus Woesebacteria bacterium]|nr:MAG: hypothetical protein HY044_04620 [Candidatus Woesebacteria bacterium]